MRILEDEDFRKTISTATGMDETEVGKILSKMDIHDLKRITDLSSHSDGESLLKMRQIMISFRGKEMTQENKFTVRESISAMSSSEWELTWPRYGKAGLVRLYSSALGRNPSVGDYELSESTLASAVRQFAIGNARVTDKMIIALSESELIDRDDLIAEGYELFTKVGAKSADKFMDILDEHGINYLVDHEGRFSFICEDEEVLHKLELTVKMLVVEATDAQNINAAKWKTDKTGQYKGSVPTVDIEASESGDIAGEFTSGGEAIDTLLDDDLFDVSDELVGTKASSATNTGIKAKMPKDDKPATSPTDNPLSDTDAPNASDAPSASEGGEVEAKPSKASIAPPKPSQEEEKAEDKPEVSEDEPADAPEDEEPDDKKVEESLLEDRYNELEDAINTLDRAIALDDLGNVQIPRRMMDNVIVACEREGTYDRRGDALATEMKNELRLNSNSTMVWKTDLLRRVKEYLRPQNGSLENTAMENMTNDALNNILKNAGLSEAKSKRNPVAKALASPICQPKVEKSPEEKAKADDKWDRKAKHKKKPGDNIEETVLEDFAIGDNVMVGEEKGQVKVPRGPSGTIGVVINGSLRMVEASTVSHLNESVLGGMVSIPSINRIRELAGLRSGSIKEFEEIPSLNDIHISSPDDEFDEPLPSEMDAVGKDDTGIDFTSPKDIASGYAAADSAVPPAQSQAGDEIAPEPSMDAPVPVVDAGDDFTSDEEMPSGLGSDLPADINTPMDAPLDGIPGDIGATPMDTVGQPAPSSAMSQIQDEMNNIQRQLSDIKMSEYKALVKKLEDLAGQVKLMGSDYLGQ